MEQHSHSNGAPPPADLVEVLPNYNGSGRTLVRFTWNNPWPAPSSYYISIKTVINDYAVAGTNDQYTYDEAYYLGPFTELDGLKNTGFFTGTSPRKCTYTDYYHQFYVTQDSLDVNGNGSVLDSLCYGADYIGVTTQAQLESVKWVKGECDTDYTRYPDSGMTMPGGLANYKLIVTNTGNVPADEFVIIDILPFVGDMGVIDLSARSTAWRPNLVTPISAPAGVTIYYSTAQNPCRTDFVSSGPAGCTAPNWTTILPTDPTTIQSVKYDFGDLVLKPGDMIELTWDMRVPVDAPANGEIAWNSFAYKATRMDNGDTFLPAEPLKVGIATKPNQPGNYGNFVWCDTDNDGFQDIGELGIDGVRVELYLDNGDNIAFPAGDQLVAFTSTGNGGLYLFTSLDPGNYYAVFYLPAGTLVSPVNAVVDDTADSDGTAMTINSFKAAVTEITTIDASETDLNWDLGLDCDAKAALGNYVWFDQNQNNIQDEPSANGVNGVQVNLYNGTGMLIATTYTGYDIYGRPGYYLFDNLDPGDYYVDFVLNPGQTFTPSTGSVGGNGSDPEDSDADISTGQTTLTTLTAGEVDLTWDAGIIIPTGIYNLGNFVWFDINNNGIYDLGEVGVNNVTVELYNDYNNDGMPQPNEFITTSVTVTKSGVNGIYNFNNLPEGNYIVLIPESSLQGPLSGYTNSTGNGVAPDPDDNIENDDNGTPLAGYGVVSKPITIGSIAEPLEGGYTNHSVDFGFFPSPVCTMVLNCSSTNPTCGATNGTASVTVTGASGSYSVMWSNGGNTNSISNLGAGIYSVEVTDDICTRTCTVQLTNGVGPTATCAAINNTNCASPNGSVSVTTTANQYLWSNGATTATISNLTSGTFTVTVTDTSTGCTNTCQAIVANSTTNPTVTCGKIDNTNCTSPNGSATATASNVTFSWSNGATTATISNLTAGTYTVTVTSTTTGCTNTCQAIVANNTTNPTVTCGKIDNTNCTSPAGSATATASNVTFPRSNGNNSDDKQFISWNVYCNGN
ncbi:MAG: hypothetical protein IPO94_08610 [Saprospiraceae bacterium]|nr:hypothetical protein [Saprospiraceae bacterium]